ncbi:uncharacterized protein B0T15DRAFT_524005 [Chaetomium strumarium]|uniref:Uncharacterized protein n=1 Tax=Chaetomium strumarium TaxID=1170767 RepID=A0AAJ0M423_9PEZI|nr:hypothetical protein B0T15DRAFT_524005 [Chaetomium strumarium]
MPGLFHGYHFHCHPRLVPSISREDALLLEPTLNSRRLGTIRPLAWSVLTTEHDEAPWVVPATVHCDVLAAAWSSCWCTGLFVASDHHPLTRPRRCCREFKRDIFDLFDRHPKLHLFDPTIEPSRPVTSSDAMLRFRGTDATYYQVDFDEYDPDTSPWVVKPLTRGDMNVLEYARSLDDLLYCG